MAERAGRRRWGLRVVGAASLALCVYLSAIGVQVISASRLDQREDVDAIVVLGAAQYDGTPSPALAHRLDRALELYRDGLAPRIVLTGAKQSGDRFTEAYAGYRYLIERGVPESALTIVDQGASTYESLAATHRVLRSDGADRVLLVTDPYHNRRVIGIARELGMEPFVASTGIGSTASQLVGETGKVAVGEVIGYRRLFNQTR